MKPLTHGILLSSLLLLTGTAVFGYYDSDRAAMNRLTEYAAEAEVAQERYDRLESTWVDAVGRAVLDSDDFKKFSDQQADLAAKLVEFDREASEKAALDGFNLSWNRGEKTKTLIKKVREADDIHAANSGLNSIITMASNACHGTIIEDGTYEEFGLDTDEGVATYKKVVAAFEGNKTACALLDDELEQVAKM